MRGVEFWGGNWDISGFFSSVVLISVINFIGWCSSELEET